MIGPYETCDMDLRAGKSRDLQYGKAREDAFVSVMLRGKVEHKRDRLAYRTGNLAIEFEQRCRDEVVRKSGFLANDAEVAAIEYAPECWLLVPIECVRAMIRHGKETGHDVWGGDNNNAHLILAPWAWFLNPREQNKWR